MEYEDLHEIIKKISSSESESGFLDSNWSLIPEDILVRIFRSIPVKDILSCSEACKRWNFISQDTLLWKYKFQTDFKLKKNISIKPGSLSWYHEYKRLCDNVPVLLTEVLTKHTHQVLHVSFSHNGKMFATSSKDGLIVVWKASFPSEVKYECDMKALLSWKYTQFSQFNESDSLLLVSGVHFGSPHSTSGEIAVFSLIDGFNLRCRVQNKPYDVFGCWYGDQYVLSGDLRWLANLVSKSTIVLNKANQETASEYAPVMKNLYSFYNRNASSVRNLLIAYCPWLDDQEDEIDEAAGPSTSPQNQPSSSQQARERGNPVSKIAPQSRGSSLLRQLPDNSDYERSINYLDEFRQEFEETQSQSSSDLDEFSDQYAADDNDLYEEMDNSTKYLIFSTGSRTYTPHQIGIKRIGKVNFPKRLEPGLSIQERIVLRDRRRELETLINSLSPEEAVLQLEQFGPEVELYPDPDYLNFDAVANRFDNIDALLDLEGHIIGMCLSPCSRFLYVNSRPWPENCVITNPLDPPPISQEIDIHVIDLVTLKKVGTMLRAHKAYTSNTECFFIFLDVSENFVGSGAEDKHAYAWDRYYGICLASYPHMDVVNSVAFCPKNDQILITTSDDYEIRIWRSQELTRSLGIAPISRANEVKNKKKKS